MYTRAYTYYTYASHMYHPHIHMPCTHTCYTHTCSHTHTLGTFAKKTNFRRKQPGDNLTGALPWSSEVVTPLLCPLSACLTLSGTDSLIQRVSLRPVSLSPQDCPLQLLWSHSVFGTQEAAIMYTPDELRGLELRTEKVWNRASVLNSHAI